MLSGIYGALLGIEGAAAFFVAASIGRIGIAMTGLAIVWLVQEGTGSYATAGLVTGAFAVAEGVMGPQVARLIDRFGQTWVLPPVLAAHAGTVATLLLLLAVHSPSWLMIAGGALMGVTIPQLGALSAARWSALLDGEHVVVLPAAFALESLANAVAYLVGPSLASAIGATGHARLGSALAAALVVGGGLMLAAQRRTAPPAVPGGSEQQRVRGSLLRPGFGLLVAVNVAIGGFFGATRVSIAAFAVEHHAAYTAAVFSIISNIASLLASWLYGLRPWPAAHRVQLAAAAIGISLGSLPLLAAGSHLALGIGLALTGLAIPVILVVLSTLTRAAVQPAVLTQAFTWLNSASAAGSAGAAAVAGQLVDGSGAHGGFLVAVAAAFSLAITATLGHRLLPLAGTREPDS